MATRRIALAWLAALAGLAASPAWAANPLLGTWRAIRYGRITGSALHYYVTFDADGGYQTRVYFNTNKHAKDATKGAAMAVVLGGYEITGPNSYDYWETRYLVCPEADRCADVPRNGPDFGQRKSSTFKALGADWRDFGGLSWTRVK
jgi:hypothetical protein